FGTGEKVRAVRAPGRVNLIGEHTDYNDGFVFPMAIEPQVVVICRSRKNEIVKVASTVFPNEFVEFSLQKTIERGKPSWGNYVRGVAAELMAAGIPLSGMDALICNSLPVGGGLSSSAAIEVAVAKSLLLLAGLTIEPDRLALICQKAEHDFAQVPCGIMDQMVVASARIGQAMLLDCRDFTKQFVPLEPKELRVVIVNSMVKHDLGDSEYVMRRRQCEEGVEIFKRDHPTIMALRDVTMQQVEAAKGLLSEVIYRRCRHVVGENLRAIEMAQKLLMQHYDEAGELMVKSHNSLRDDYEVSCPELDFLVEQALKVKGVYGARMTGGGFGGCIVALVRPRSVEALSEHLHKTYTAEFDRQPNVFVTTATAGASVLE
ncbi:MAG: galactokinase, partial [Tepidisphaeraceae bacterium]